MSELLSRYDIVRQLREHFDNTLRQVREWSNPAEALEMLGKVHGSQLDRVLFRLEEEEESND